MVTGVKLSQITSGGNINVSTDQLVGVRSGTTDVLLSAANLSVGGTTGQVQYNNTGAFGGITGSTVSGSTVGFTIVQTPKVQSTTGLTLASGFGSIVLTSPFEIHATAASDILFTDGAGSTFQMDGGGNLGLANTVGSSLTLISDGSLVAQAGSGSILGLDSGGGVTLRAFGDTGGIYADGTNTYLGNYSTAGADVIDANGNMTIASGGNSIPNGSTILQVGPDPATGGLFTFSGANYGGQTFFDIGSFLNSVSASIRVFTDVQCGEFAAIGNAMEYFTNSQAGDCALKGDPGGGNRFLIGVGSSASQVTVEDTDVLVGLANSVGYGFLQVGGDFYAGGTAGIGTTGTSAAVLKLASGSATKAPININSGLLRTSPAGGDIEYDGTHYYGTASSIRYQLDSRILCTFTGTADATVTNTTTETTILPTGVGSKTLAANFFLVGKTVSITGGGVYSTTTVPGNLVINVKYGSTVVATGTITNLLNSASNRAFQFDVTVVCRTTGSSGTVICDGNLDYETSASLVARTALALNNSGSTTTINTTTSNAIDITATWATASTSNIFKVTNASIEILN